MTAIGAYNIAWGDTLSQIAARAGSTMQTLQALNPQIVDPDLIHAGDTLRLAPGGGMRPGGDTAAGIQAVAAPAAPLDGANAAAIAEQFLGRNAGELKHSGELPMERWVPNDVNCANFVSACLAGAGLISSDMQSASVATLDGNLQGAGWQKVSLDNARPGDVVIMPNRHVVLFAGMENGQPKFIGSNNINPDNSQQVSWGGASGDYYILAQPR